MRCLFHVNKLNPKKKLYQKNIFKKKIETSKQQNHNKHNF